MKLLQEKDLIWSTVVANNTMNRERNLLGVNSYEQDINIDIAAFLKEKANSTSTTNWVDLCCGRGKALLQAAQLIKEWGLTRQISLEGLDLVDMFEPFTATTAQFTVTSLLDWQPTKQYDLITCIHGLHYIGDKLKVLEQFLSYLKPDGKFIANLDLDNIKTTSGKSLKKKLLPILKEADIYYDSKKRLITCEGSRKIAFDYHYLGADDKAGPNYTGQAVVNAVYGLE